MAVGCLAERYGEELAEALPEADAVLGFDDYADISDRLQTILAGGPTSPHAPRDRRKLLPLAPADRAPPGRPSRPPTSPGRTCPRGSRRPPGRARCGGGSATVRPAP